MRIINRVLIVKDESSALTVAVDLVRGLVTLTDGQTVALSGRFKKADTQKLLKTGTQTNKK